MMKFLKSGTTYFPAANVQSLTPKSGATTTLSILHSGSQTAVEVANLTAKTELLIEEINYGKQVIIDLEAIAAL